MDEITARMFNGRFEARLLKVEYLGLPAISGQINITPKDEILITRVDDRAISLEITRSLIPEPKALHEISVTTYLRINIGDQYHGIPSLKTLDIVDFISKYKNELTNIAFVNMSYIISSLTTSFGKLPLITLPLPAQNTVISLKE